MTLTRSRESRTVKPMVTEFGTNLGVPFLAIANQYYDQQADEVKRARYRLILVRGSDLRWLNRERLQEVEAGLRTQHKWLPEQDLAFSEVVLYAYAADCVYIAAHALQTNLQERNFPDRRVRRRVPPEDLDEHRRTLRALHQRAAASKQ